MLLIGTAMFGIFFFLTIFVQTVLGYSALKSGVAFLPFAGMMVVVSGIAGRLIARTGARPLMLAGAAATAGGMYWFSRISVHTTYASGLLGPSLITAAGLGLLFVPLALVALNRVRHEDSGAGLQPAQHRPAARWRDRAGRARHGGLDRGRQQHPQPGGSAATAARAGPHPGQHPGGGVDLPRRPHDGHHPRVPGRLGDRAGRPGGRGRSPSGSGREEPASPAAAGQGQPVSAEPVPEPTST